MPGFNIYVGLIIWIACCGLLAFMGSKRKIGWIRALLVPVISGVVIFLLILAGTHLGLFSYNYMEDPSKYFLLPFGISLVLGYAAVKTSSLKNKGQ